MKIGYACINLSLECRSSRTFRLKNYSEKKMIETVSQNLECLLKILRYNAQNQIYFFRITSDLIPFASHPVMKFNWQDYFEPQFREIGNFIKKNSMRITMHPGQYTVLNSKNERVVENSINELNYHINVIDLLGLDSSAKVITHVGGVYGNKNESVKRFKKIYKTIDPLIKEHHVIENDDKSYSLSECVELSELVGIPTIFDAYHHQCLNRGLLFSDAINLAFKTWNERDGLPIVHYSSQNLTKGKPSHADNISMKNFRKFVEKTRNLNFDLMLEIKDKERSALKAIKFLKNDPRFLSDT